MKQRICNLIAKVSDYLRRAYVAPVAALRSAWKESGRSVASVFTSCRQHLKTLMANTVPVLCAAVFVTTAFTVGETVMAYEVTYGSKVIGYVTNTALVDSVAQRVDRDILAKYGNADFVATYSTTLCLADKTKIDNASTLYASMVEATPGITAGCGIYAADRLVAICPDVAAAQVAVQSRLDAYRAAHPDCGEINIAYNVEYREGLFPTGDIMDTEAARLAAQNLSVMETVVSTYSADIDFKTISSSSSQYCTGTTIITTEGKKGLQQVTAKICYINGVQVSCQELETTIISQPVDQVVVVGTKKPVITEANKLTWPIDGSAYYLITAYWGDGRDHRAIDIACDKGTAILAAKGGTVVETYYNHSTYGHYILIDHGNGIMTRYAHCSAISVSKGDVVTAGQVIGAVGNTGRSTGPHLHFEYIIDGQRVNPAPYLGK